MTLLLDVRKGDERGVIHTLQEIMNTDKYVFDPSLITTLQQFCVLYVLDLKEES